MMLKQKIYQVLGSRLALNIYFWLMMFLIKSPTVNYVSGYSNVVYYGLIIYFLGLLAILSYVHNFFILPHIFFKKKYFLYVITTGVWLFVMAYFYTFCIKYIPILVPHLDVLRMSIMMSPVSNDISWLGVINDIQTYFFVMLMWLFIFALLAIYHHNNKRVKRMEQAILAHKEQELAFLKSQLNPHFLFNTLNNVYGLSLRKDEQTSDVIWKLSNVLRYLLYDSNAAQVRFNVEREILFSYIDLELLRLGESDDNQFLVQADRNYAIPPLLWLPILENVFKHTRNLQHKQIEFNWRIESHVWYMFAANLVSENNTNERRGGIGLSNLRKRLDLLYPNDYTWQEQVIENRYSINIQINLPHEDTSLPH